MIVLFYFFTCFNSSRALWILAYAQTSPISFVHVEHLFERGKRVFLFGYYSGLVSKTTLNETDKIITNCFACVCVCVFIHAKKNDKNSLKVSL